MLSDSVVQDKHGCQAAEQGKQCQHVSQAADGALAPFPLPVGGLLVLLDIPAATPSQSNQGISCSSPIGDSRFRLSSLTGAQVSKQKLAGQPHEALQKGSRMCLMLGGGLHCKS